MFSPLQVRAMRRDKPTVTKSRSDFETVNQRQPGSGLFVEFSVLKWSLRPRVIVFQHSYTVSILYALMPML